MARRWWSALWPVVLALGWLGSFCAAAQAQDAPPDAAPVVTVVSGEHKGFSRLVLRLGGLRDWRLGRTAAGYELW
ncbi:MAG: hypothetical protein EBU97_06855, partial [Rhodobacteraceae bacterium]|nr:hypothetical protein [Paracoccaceae bacterium]